jgi:5-methyltetrahydrofolate--homocysteine methyltransferase
MPSEKRSLLDEASVAYILADGAMGTELRNAGLPETTSAEIWNAENPDAVQDLHRRYSEAGAQCTTTNTFGCNPFRLAGPHAYGFDLVALNRRAALLAANSCDGGPHGRTHWILGSVGPCSGPGERLALTDPQGVSEAYVVQILSLQERADAILIETVTCLEEGRLAMEAARAALSDTPVIVSLCFEKLPRGAGYRIPLSGESLDDAIANVISWKPAAVGMNCGINIDIQDYPTLIAALRAKFSGVIIARPPAGLDPRNPDPPEIMTDGIWGLVRAGANIIGGCCGTTPEHIRMFRKELDKL